MIVSLVDKSDAPGINNVFITVDCMNGLTDTGTSKVPPTKTKWRYKMTYC